jgi:peptidoglycan/xylan/chitin deacetylase (PgdA/CDA1 family)
MPLYYWSIDTEDWKSRDAQKVYNAVIKNAKDGDIVLMHDIYSSTAEAVEKIVPKLIEEGYQLVTVSELIQVKTGNPPTAGQQYVDATTINNNTN